jgi:hypothetical protein
VQPEAELRLVAAGLVLELLALHDGWVGLRQVLELLVGVDALHRLDDGHVPARPSPADQAAAHAGPELRRGNGRGGAGARVVGDGHWVA